MDLSLAAFCINNDEFCTKHDDLCIKKNDELCIKIMERPVSFGLYRTTLYLNDEFCIQNDEIPFLSGIAAGSGMH